LQNVPIKMKSNISIFIFIYNLSNCVYVEYIIEYIVI